MVDRGVTAVLGRVRSAGSVSITELADVVIDVYGASDRCGQFAPYWTAHRVGSVIQDVLRAAQAEGFLFTIDPDGPGIPDVITSPTPTPANDQVSWVVDGGHERLRVPLAVFADAMTHATGYGYLDLAAGVVYLEGDVEAATFLTAHPTIQADRLAVEHQSSNAPCRANTTQHSAEVDRRRTEVVWSNRPLNLAPTLDWSRP